MSLTGPPTQPATLSIDDVATMLGISRRTFSERRRALEAAGFPPSLPVLACRWSQAAVREWIDGAHRRAPTAAAGASGEAPAGARPDRRAGGAGAPRAVGPSPLASGSASVLSFNPAALRSRTAPLILDPKGSNHNG